jgi:hypothetical protein
MMRRRKIYNVLSRNSIIAVLLTCCGCPSKPTSQDHPSGIPTRWITIESTNEPSGSKLSVNDADAIVAQLPIVSELVLERVYSATIRSEDVQAAVEISATGPSCLRFLKETALAEVTAGRFLEAADSEAASTVIVLDEKLAEKLFAEMDPIGRSVTIGQQTLTVVGMVTQPRSGRSGDVTRDAYLPRESFTEQPSEANDESAESLDRIRVRVDSLDQVEAAKSLIRAIIKQLHPDETIVVR